MMLCEKCLYNKNCQFLAKTKIKITGISDCSAYTTLEEHDEEIKQQVINSTVKEVYLLLDTMKVNEDERHYWRTAHNDCIDKCKAKIKERYGMEVCNAEMAN